VAQRDEAAVLAHPAQPARCAQPSPSPARRRRSEGADARILGPQPRDEVAEAPLHDAW